MIHFVYKNKKNQPSMKLAPYIKYAITIFFWTLLLYMHTSKVPVKKQEFTYKLKQLDPAEKLLF